VSPSAHEVPALRHALLHGREVHHLLLVVCTRRVRALRHPACADIAYVLLPPAAFLDCD